MARLVPDETLCFDCLCRRLDIPATTTAVPDAALGLPALARNLWLESVYPQLATHASIVVTRNGVSTPHVALAVPECVACRQSLKHASPRILPLRDVYVPDEAAPLADAETGVLREVAVYHPADDQQPSFPSCASARLLLPLPDGGSATIRGEGKGVTAADAVHGAIGEGIERYAASLWPADRLRRAVFRPEHAFDPRWLVLYEEEQYAQPGFPFARFDPDARLSWTWGRWLDDDSLVWVPALATWLDFPVAASERFAQVTSSGLATGSSYEDAALRAVYELIERDAFMRFWMSRTHPVRLLDVDIDEPVRRALHAIERQGAQVEVHVLEDASGHATVLCAGYGDGQRWPGLTVGLGTHASLTVAVRKAVLEHSHYGLYMQRLMREGRHHAVREAADVRSNLDHGLWYVDPARQIAMRARTRHAAAESMIHAARRFTHDATLRGSTTALARTGIRVAAVDVTPADIAVTPYRVVRAFAPFLQPVHFGFRMERRVNPRVTWRDDAWTPHPLA
nr:YcaO-like family protein [Luteibacter sp. Sphag1AF]